jgi:hypothetical protein
MLMPLRPGGGPTEEAKTYRVLRAAVGVGGSAQDDSGIDGLWRWSRARALAAASSARRRAVNNAFPQLATDLLSYYERVLGLPAGSTLPHADRRTAVTELWPASASAAFPDILAALQQIDSRFSLVIPDDDKSGTSWDGRWFGPLTDADEEPAFGGEGFSRLAAFTSRYVLVVLFDVGYLGAYLAADARKAAAADRVLRTALPSFWGWHIVTSVGFLAGVSPVGMTGVEDTRTSEE